MADAGLADGFTTEIWYNSEDQQEAMAAQMIQNQLREINIEVVPRALEWGAFLDALYGNEHQGNMFLLGWYTPTGDSEYGMYGLSHSESINNLAHMFDPDIDRLLMEGRKVLDDSSRLAIYAELQQIIRDVAGYLHYHYPEELHISTPDVRGLVINPNGQHDLWRVTFD